MFDGYDIANSSTYVHCVVTGHLLFREKPRLKLLNKNQALTFRHGNLTIGRCHQIDIKFISTQSCVAYIVKSYVCTHLSNTNLILLVYTFCVHF